MQKRWLTEMCLWGWVDFRSGIPDSASPHHFLLLFSPSVPNSEKNNPGDLKLQGLEGLDVWRQSDSKSGEQIYLGFQAS